MRWRKLGVQPDRFLKRRFGLPIHVLLCIDQAQIVMCIYRNGVQRNRPLKRRFGLPIHVLLCIDQAQIVMCIYRNGVQRNRPLKRPGSPLKLFVACVDHSQLNINRGIIGTLSKNGFYLFHLFHIRIQPFEYLQLPLSLVGFSLSHVGHTQTIVGLRVFRIDLQSPFVRLNSLRILTLF